MAVLTTSLSALRRDFNAAFPNRDKTSDGWIGDTAHQASVSGHNPDDTPGSKSEYSDADTKAEVRAVDVDADLRGDRTMAQVIARILITPADIRRLRYIIYNRIIWSRSAGWVGRTYYGDNPHDKHAHFSGDPATDEDASPWSVVARAATGADDMTDEQWKALQRVERLLTAQATRLMPEPGPGETADRTDIVIEPWPGGPTEVPNVVDWMADQLTTIKGQLADLSTPEPLDYGKLARALLAEIGTA